MNDEKGRMIMTKSKFFTAEKIMPRVTRIG